MENITPYNEKGEPHGYWEQYWLNGNLAYRGNYINGQLNGLWECYDNDGILIRQIFFA